MVPPASATIAQVAIVLYSTTSASLLLSCTADSSNARILMLLHWPAWVFPTLTWSNILDQHSMMNQKDGWWSHPCCIERRKCQNGTANSSNARILMLLHRPAWVVFLTLTWSNILDHAMMNEKDGWWSHPCFIEKRKFQNGTANSSNAKILMLLLHRSAWVVFPTLTWSNILDNVMMNEKDGWRSHPFCIEKRKCQNGSANSSNAKILMLLAAPSSMSIPHSNVIQYPGPHYDEWEGQLMKPSLLHREKEMPKWHR